MTCLRPLGHNDAQAIYEAVNRSRPALRRWMSWYRDDYDEADAEWWLTSAAREREAGASQHFAICADDGALVGIIGFEDIADQGNGAKRAMIGYWIETPATGRGLGTRAVRDAIDWARANTRVETVWAIVAEPNLASRRVLERNGFQVARIAAEPSVSGDEQLIYELELARLGG